MRPRISQFTAAAAWLVFLTAWALVPAAAHARLLFEFLPPLPPTEEARALQADLLARLERTHRYGLVESEKTAPALAAGPSPGALGERCGAGEGPDKLARLHLESGTRHQAHLEVFDCALGRADPVMVQAGSATLKNLAASLRADFIKAYPLLLTLTAEAGRLFVSAGPAEKLGPGTLLYSYVEERPRVYRLRRRLRVARYHEAAFRSELSELYRMPDAGAAVSGEVVSERPLVDLAPARALSRPFLQALRATRRLAGPSELLRPAAFDPPAAANEQEELVATSRGHWLAAPARMAAGAGWSLSLEAWLSDGGRLQLARRSAGVPGVLAVLAGGELVLSAGNDRLGTGALVRAPLARSEGWVPLELVCYGPWTELYLAGRFVAGLEDFSAAPERLWLAGGPAGTRLRALELFELRPAPPAAQEGR